MGLFRLLYGSRMKQFEGIPGPVPRFPFGTAPDMLEWPPWRVLARYATDHGPVALIWKGGRPAIVLNSPDAIAEVLVDRPLDFYKDAPLKALFPVVTKTNLFVTNPPAWERDRETSPLVFGGFDHWLDSQVAPLRNTIEDSCQRLAGQHTRDLYQTMQRLAFDAFSVAFWGQTQDDHVYRDFITMARTGSLRTSIQSAGLPLLPPVSPWFWIAHRRFYRHFYDRVVKAKQSPDPDSRDLLTVTLAQGTPLDDTELSYRLATKYYGGGFSCPSAVTSALYQLAQHPDIASQLQDQLKQLPSDFTHEQMESCRLLDQVVRESLRLHCPVPVFLRNVLKTKSAEVAGHKLPPDTEVIITNRYLHRCQEHWDDPDRFHPERWDEATTAANPYGSGYFFPFGRGPRTCLGMPFGRFYIKLALTVLLRNLRVEVDPSQPYVQTQFFAVMMPKGLKADFEPVAGDRC